MAIFVLGSGQLPVFFPYRAEKPTSLSKVQAKCSFNVSRKNLATNLHDVVANSEKKTFFFHNVIKVSNYPVSIWCNTKELSETKDKMLRSSYIQLCS